jgi:hypothetical protein
MTGKLPPTLEDLREQLREAAARDIEVERRVAEGVRSGRWRRRLIVLGAALAAAGGVAVAQRVLDREGAPVRPDRLPGAVEPAADPGVIATSATADPEGGPPWALRVFTNARGQDCVALGRLSRGRLGTYDADRVFRRLPTRVSGVCDSLARTGIVVGIIQRPAPQPRTIVYGLARDGRPVRITIAGTTHTVAPGALGSFVDVRAGALDTRGASASTTAGGRTVRRQLGP